MLIVVLLMNIVDLSVVVFKAQALIIVIHRVVKRVQVVLADRLILHFVLLFFHLRGLAVGSRDTRSARFAPEISINTFGHLVASSGGSSTPARHDRPLEVEVLWHKRVQSHYLVTFHLTFLRRGNIDLLILRGVYGRGTSYLVVLILLLLFIFLLNFMMISIFRYSV
jgi:hypothetical protein